MFVAASWLREASIPFAIAAFRHDPISKPRIAPATLLLMTFRPGSVSPRTGFFRPRLKRARSSCPKFHLGGIRNNAELDAIKNRIYGEHKPKAEASLAYEVGL
jgi:hypothetical protein